MGCRGAGETLSFPLLSGEYTRGRAPKPVGDVWAAGEVFSGLLLPRLPPTWTPTPTLTVPAILSALQDSPGSQKPAPALFPGSSSICGMWPGPSLLRWAQRGQEKQALAWGAVLACRRTADPSGPATSCQALERGLKVHRGRVRCHPAKLRPHLPPLPCLEQWGWAGRFTSFHGNRLLDGIPNEA